MAIYQKHHKREGITYYYIRFQKADGHRKVEQAGTTLEQARRLVKKRQGEVVDGTYIDPRDVEEQETGPTFGEFADRFMKEYGDLRRSDYYTEAVTVLRQYFAGRLLDSITRADLEAFGRARQAGTVPRPPKEGKPAGFYRPSGPSTVRKNLIVAGTMFRRAVRWGVLETSPAADLEKPREPHHKERYLSREEYATLRNAAPPWLRPMIRLAVVTGLRLKEVVGLAWDGVDREAQLLHVSEDNKTERPRAVPLGEVAGEILAGQVRHVRSPYIFTDSTGAPYTSKRARNLISKTTKALMVAQRIEGATFHTLRHTAASWAAQAGESGVSIARFLGHATGASMTDRYMHLNPEHYRGIVRALDAAERAAQAMATQMATYSDPSLDAESAGVVNSHPASDSHRMGR